MNKSIILLSGGLDSLVSLGICKEKYNISLALTFDYGQKSYPQEYEASKTICEYYNIKHKVITLDWLRQITKTSLVAETEIPIDKNTIKTQDSMKSVWVPNRNGLFLNIAASVADAENYTHILIGANKEEAQTFSDNSPEFIDSINKEFQFSTQVKPKVIAPLITFDKTQTIKIALEKGIPLELLYSCYKLGQKHCGECESCSRLKSALIANNAEKYLKILF